MYLKDLYKSKKECPLCDKPLFKDYSILFEEATASLKNGKTILEIKKPESGEMLAISIANKDHKIKIKKKEEYILAEIAQYKMHTEFRTDFICGYKGGCGSYFYSAISFNLIEINKKLHLEPFTNFVEMVMTNNEDGKDISYYKIDNGKNISYKLQGIENDKETFIKESLEINISNLKNKNSNQLYNYFSKILLIS